MKESARVRVVVVNKNRRVGENNVQIISLVVDIVGK